MSHTTSRSKRVAVTLMALAIVAVGLPASAGPGHSGTWNYTVGPVTCTFTGSHVNFGSKARGSTYDDNNGCGNLKVRIKYHNTFTGIVQQSVWQQSTTSPSSFHYNSPEDATVIASEHQAYNGWLGTWSPVQRPHAW